MLVEHLDVVAHQLLRREGVQASADGIDGAGDIFSGPAGGALEEHVLDEMRDAVLFMGFAAGAGADPDADGDRTHVGHHLGNDFDTVG